MAGIRAVRPGFRRQTLEALIKSLTDAIGTDAAIHTVSVPEPDASETSALDDAISIKMQNSVLTIHVEIVSSGYPRDIRNAVRRLNLRKNVHRHPGDIIGMVAAQSLSPGSKRELKESGFAYYESGGSLFLKHGFWLINIEKPSNPVRKKEGVVDLFTDARENVVHALLMHNDTWLSGTELARLAQTSQYTCSLVLQELILREWVNEEGKGPGKRRKLIRPGLLLDAWAENWRGRNAQESRWYAFVENPGLLLGELAERIDTHQIDFAWAFTGTAAANTIVPVLTGTDSAEIVVADGDGHLMAEALNLKPAPKGANISLVERRGASLLFRSKCADRLGYFASPYILYLDLLNGRGRNKELADSFRKHLELLWQRN